jgi:hypothetical protein
MQAALFTAIVTAFVLGAMSDLDEDDTAKLLRVLIKQNMITNPAIEIPPPNPPPSILMVNSLWLLSIVSSLAATTWAILCLEWCAFLSDHVQAEDYQEMAEKRQRRFEAVKRWRVHLVVAAIPFFLHLSLFLFLAGLWLRVRDMNKNLGLIVGVPSLAMTLSYVVVTLLPIFTEAPFLTSVSELAQLVAGEVRRIARLYRPPRVFRQITSPLLVGSLPRTFANLKTSSHFSWVRTRRFTAFPRSIYKITRLYIHTWQKTIALVMLPIIPTFGSDQNPFNELNKLKVGLSDRGKGIHLRALFWLMNTPLSQDEVKDILKEFKRLNTAGTPLDRSIIKLLVLSLSSVLQDGGISFDEQPIFDHCTRVLAAEMDRAFGDGGYNKRIPFRNTWISDRLLPYFCLTPPEDTGGSTQTNQGADYWTRAVPALWLSPSRKTIQNVVTQLNADLQSAEAHGLRLIVNGFHAAMLARLDPNKPALTDYDLIPDFNDWTWDYSSSDSNLDKALSAFLRSLFAAFYTNTTVTLKSGDSSVPVDTPTPITTPSLIVDCLTVLDENPEDYPFELHRALCFFVAVMWRSNPEVFEEAPSVADALLKSAKSYGSNDRVKDDSTRVTILTTRLRAIARGPKPLISQQNNSLESLRDLHTRLPKSITRSPQCLEGFLDANAAILEAVFAVDSQFPIVRWKDSPDYKIARTVCSNPFTNADITFRSASDHPNYRLPYLYSLAIILSYTAEGKNQELWKVAGLLVTCDEQREMPVNRALDTNILVLGILGFAPGNPSDPVEELKDFGGIPGLLENIGNDWRTRWKAIYLITDCVRLLSQTNGQGPARRLIDKANDLIKIEVERKGNARVPSDWRRKEEGLRRCGLDASVKDLANERGEDSEGVYAWRGQSNIPYLSLYNPPRAPTEPISHAMLWVTNRFNELRG